VTIMPPASLIVLRFRDIELPLGETIARHRTAIAQHGFCWWGWLFRDYERNPHAELRALAESLGSAGPFPVGLLDTGRGVVLQATCRSLRATSSPQRSPERVATPDYYNERRAPAWFQLTEIKEADHTLVVGKTCVQLPSASEDCFVDLQGQVVRHIKDLRRQEVTLWVLG
jgi:hypothetical protein